MLEETSMVQFSRMCISSGHADPCEAFNSLLTYVQR